MNAATQMIQVENDTSPEYVRRQWSRLFAERCSENLRFVRVQNEVATVTNKAVVLRSPIKAEDGLYQLTLSGELQRISRPIVEYPDVDLWRPPLEKMQPRCQMPRDDVRGFTTWLQRAREDNSSVMMDKTGCCHRSQPSIKAEYPFNLPDEMVFNPTFLQLAFNSMKPYAGVYLAVEDDVSLKDRPLFIGINWNECALVFPNGSKMTSNYYW